MNKNIAIFVGLLFVGQLRAANYTAEKISAEGGEAVRLGDAAKGVVVSISPGAGNKIYALSVHGKEILASGGIPFLAPWANRLDQDAFWANGKKYILNPGLNAVRYDNNHLPIHGLLDKAVWTVTGLKANKDHAEVTAELQFWRHPDWMAQFPFAHKITMTHRLHEGVLEVETKIDNLSDDAMPISVGYHPWFQLSGIPRDEWKLHLAARKHVKLSKTKIPTGEDEPISFPNPLALKSVQLDDILGDLVRDEHGQATFSIDGNGPKISVIFGPKYRNAVVYAPPGREVVCIEPMSGPTNAFNLAHEGKYPDLQSVPPRGAWQESFRIQAEGF